MNKLAALALLQHFHIGQISALSDRRWHDLRNLIRRMWQANPAWGSPRLVAELHKLGIEVAKSPVEQYKPLRDNLPSATWRAFLDLHLKELVAIDFFIVPTAKFKSLKRFLSMPLRVICYETAPAPGG